VFLPEPKKLLNPVFNAFAATLGHLAIFSVANVASGYPKVFQSTHQGFVLRWSPDTDSLGFAFGDGSAYS
jgi:hypothetical protein